MQGSQFLTDTAEAERFERDYHLFPRKVVRQQQATARRDASDVVPQPVESLMREQLERLERASEGVGHGLWITSIAIQPGDGADWTATAIDQVVGTRAGTLKLRRIRFNGHPTLGGLPEIARIVGERTFARLARKCRVTTRFRVLAPWLHPLVAIPVAALAAVLTKLASDRLLKDVPLVDALTPSALVLALLAAASVTSQTLAKRQTRVDSAQLAELATELATARGSPAYRDLIAACAQWLTVRELPRCVIVNRFGNLDEMTRGVLTSYFIGQAHRSMDCELWVMVESGSETFVATIVAEPGQSKLVNRIERFEQCLLDADERVKLAEYSNLPERADFPTVRAIRHVTTDIDDTITHLLQPYHSRPDREHGSGPLDLFSVLAIGSAFGGTPLFPVEALLSRLAMKSGLRQDVLRALLPGIPLNKAPLRAVLGEAVDTFGRFIERDQVSGRLRIDSRCGSFLARHHGTYGLPEPRPVHFFWALLCRDASAAPTNSAFWVRKLAAHLILVGSTDLLGLPEPLERQAREEFLEAILLAVRKCLDWCVLDPVPNLVELAFEDVTAGAQPARSTAARRLRALAWRAYSILGDRRALEVALALDPASGTRRRTAAPALDASDELFVASIVVPATFEGQRNRMLTALRRSPDPALAYVRSWSTYFSHLLQSTSIGSDLPMLGAAHREGVTLLPQVLEATCDRIVQTLASPAKSRTSGAGTAKPTARASATSAVAQQLTVDLLAVSLGIWALTRSFVASDGRVPPEPQALLGVLESAYLAAREADERNRDEREAREGPDLTVGLLASELWSVLVACAATLGAPTGAGEPNVLDEMLATGLSRLSAARSPDPRTVVLERLQLLVGVYDGLGLTQLASLANVRLAEWIDSESRAGPVDILLHDLEKPGPTGLLTLAVAALKSNRSGEVSAKFWTSLADCAIDTGLDNRLVEELSLIAIRTGSTYGNDLRKPIAAVLGTADPQRLRRTFLALADGDLDGTTVALLNAVRRTSGTADDDQMVKLLTEVVAELSGSPTALAISRELRLYRLQSQISSSDAVDTVVELQRWRDEHGKDHTYARLLRQILEVTKYDDSVLTEADAVLAELTHDDGWSVYILLALLVAEHSEATAPNDPDARARLRHAVDVIAKCFRDWEDTLRVEINIDLLRILAKHSQAEGARKVYRQNLVDWEIHRYERDRVVTLPLLFRAGRHFLLYSHYARNLAFWRLPADRDWSEVLPLLEADGPMRHEILRRWRAAGEHVPDPFEGSGRSAVLATDFLVVGSALFEADDAESGVKAARQRFDAQALQSLNTLFAVIAAAPSIPPEIRAILDKHRLSLADSALTAT